jgi:hypothetical protein
VLAQVELEQGDGPHGVRVTEALGTASQEFLKQLPLGVGQQSGASGAAGVSQDSGVAVAAIGGKPVVDGPSTHPQAAGDRGNRLPRGDFENGQGAAVHSGIVSGPQLLFQTPPLPVGQGQGVHWLSSLPFRLPTATSV